MVARGASAAERLRGVVLGLQPSRGEAVVRHESLSGMPAMTMAFKIVPRSALAQVRIGDNISAEVNEATEPWTLSHVAVVAREAASAPVQAIRRVPILQEGDRVPQTPFRDQASHRFSFANFLGKDVVLAFIYTRCRDARMCPLISAKFAQLQTALNRTDTHLVEITLDPQYDTPAVLQRYARLFGARADRWTLGTGETNQVLDFDARFGIQPFADPAVGIIHTERTAIIDRSGAIRYLVDDPGWSIEGIIAQVNAIDRRANNPIARLDLALSRAAVAICGDRVAGFSGLLDLAVFLAIVAGFGWAFFRIGRAIQRGI